MRTALHWQPVRVYVDLFRYRDLFLNLFRRELRVKYRGSALGLGLDADQPDRADARVLARLLGHRCGRSRSSTTRSSCSPACVVWVFFQSALQMSCTSLLGQASLVKQVRLPRQLLPVSVVATNLVTLLVMLAVILPLNLLIIPETRSTFWAALPLFIPLAALVTRLRDRARRGDGHVPRRRASAHDGAAPVVHPDADLLHVGPVPGINEHPTLADVLHYGNVVAPFVTAIRDPLFFGELPQLGDVVYAFGVAIGMLVVAAFVFRRIDDQLAAQL